MSAPHIGILALQGDVREHRAVLEGLGAIVTPVRRARELAALDGIVIPGGESTTMDTLLTAFDLREALVAALDSGLPAYGSCAGMIMLARDILDGAHGQRTLGTMPMTVRRNAFGRQVDSAEVDLTWAPDATRMRATFIRAPWVEAHDADVEVLATADAYDARVVAVRHGRNIATAFHPEISGDTRVHQAFLDLVGQAR